MIQMKGKVRIVGWEAGEDPQHRNAGVLDPSRDEDPLRQRVRAARGPDWKRPDQDCPRTALQVLARTPRSPHRDRGDDGPHGARFVDGKLNLWRGFGVEEDFANWPLLRRHIVDVICGGNEDHANYLLRWIAWTLQHPTEPSEVVIVLRGRTGTGKGVLGRILTKLFGGHGMQISDRKHLVGSLNAHLLQVCLLFADEAFWPGDKSAEGMLKRMITEPTLFVEPKGLDGFEVKNRLSIIMASNEGWVVPASEDERRCGPMSKTILVVDDEMLIALDIQSQLQELGHTVHVAPSLKEALALLERERIDVAIVDWHLQNDISAPLTEYLTEHHIPFVLCSGSAFDELAGLFPAVPIISKPFASDALLDVLSRVAPGVVH